MNYRIPPELFPCLARLEANARVLLRDAGADHIAAAFSQGVYGPIAHRESQQRARKDLMERTTGRLDNQYRIKANKDDAIDLAYLCHHEMTTLKRRDYPKGIWRLIYRHLRFVFQPPHYNAEPGAILSWVGFGDMGRRVAKNAIRINLMCSR